MNGSNFMESIFKVCKKQGVWLILCLMFLSVVMTMII